MADGQQFGADAAQQILTPLGVPQAAKAQAWDAYHSAANPDDFQKRMGAVAIPRAAKAALWDAKYGQALKAGESVDLGAAPLAAPSDFARRQPETFEQAVTPGISARHPVAMTAANVTGDILAGAAKGAIHTLEAPGGVAEWGLERVPGYKGSRLQKTLNAPVPMPGVLRGGPAGLAQRVGYGAEQAGEYFVPIADEEKLAAKAGELAGRFGGPLTRAAAKLAARSAVQGATTGAVAGLQSGTLSGAERGAELGAIAAPASELAIPIARRVPMVKGLVADYGPRMQQALPQAGSFDFAKPTRREVYEAARQHGIEMTPAEATGAKPLQAVQAVGERSILSAGQKLQDLKERNSAALDAWTQDFGSRLDPFDRGAETDRAGMHLQTSANVARDVAQENVRQAYQRVAEQTPDLRIDLAAARKKWAGELGKLREQIPFLPSAQARRVEELVVYGSRLGVLRGQQAASKLAISSATGVPMDTAQQMRSLLWGIRREQDLPDRVHAIAATMAHDVDDAIETSMARAATQGRVSKDAYENWRRANAASREIHEDFAGRSPLARILKANDPAQAAAVVASPGATPETIRTLRGNGFDLGPVKRDVLNRIAAGGFRASSGKLGGYSEAYLRELFGDNPAQYRELLTMTRTARAIGHEVNPSGTSNALLGEAQAHQLVRNPVRSVTGAPGVSALAARISNPATPIGARYRALLLGLPRETQPGELLAPALGGAARAGAVIGGGER